MTHTTRVVDVFGNPPDPRELPAGRDAETLRFMSRWVVLASRPNELLPREQLVELARQTNGWLLGWVLPVREPEKSPAPVSTCFVPAEARDGQRLAFRVVRPGWRERLPADFHGYPALLRVSGAGALVVWEARIEGNQWLRSGSPPRRDERHPCDCT